MTPADPAGGKFAINNYYETDGHDLMGGAGIYARISDGKLTLVLKSHVTDTFAGVAIHTFEYAVDSTVLTFADDGKDTIYILAGDKLITKITLSGEVEYNDFYSLVDPVAKFAAKAEVINADNEVVTIENTLIATTPTQVGVAVRPQTIKFRSIEVAQFSSITIPEEYYRGEITPPADGIWSTNDAESKNTHVSNDEITATVTDTSVALKAWGWIGLTAEFESFGYKIDDGEVVLSTDWTHEAEDAVKNAAAGTGATVSSRFNILTTVDGIAAGDHTVKFIYKLTDGTLVCFATATFTVAAEEPEEPVESNKYEADISNTQQWVTFEPAGYTGNIAKLGYGGYINIGEVDLSKYSKVTIMYGCDGGDGTKAHFEALNGDLPIGLKSTNTTYGQVTDYDMDGDIAHTDMEFSSTGWAGGQRAAVIDLSEIDYNGVVYVTVHNPEGTEIAISSVIFE